MGKSRGKSPQPPRAAEKPAAPPANSSNNSIAPIKTPKAVNGSYKSDGVEDNDVFCLPGSDYFLAFAVTLLATAVRLFRIYLPTSVVFDEVHFGGFASKYIKGRFFMDVHPPLAKMLIALAGWLAGFDGNFDFKDIGKDYLEPGVPYVAMRLYPAICGILLAPSIFLTLKAAGCRTMTATLGAGLVIFENGLLTQARLILLDSPLVGATAFTAMAFTCFTNQHELGPEKAFQFSWWFWLAMSGLGLGITASIKWVGLFTIAWVGSLTVLQLWVLLGDAKNVSLRLWTKHLMARAFCLIIIPVTFYMAMFAIHFLCLVNPGEGDGFMSSEFQATLNSKGMRDVPADVIFGSRVSIRHVNTQGGYLHSHPLMYPTGSKQQQITLYPHKDENNVWILENQTQPLGIDGQPINGTFAWDSLPEVHHITNGAIVRLYHAQTFRRLHSHDVRPPVTEADWQNEVSAYGYEGFEGDANDYFRIEIVGKQSKGPAGKERLRTIETKFRLIHTMTGCALFSHKVKLPDWASEQQEVTCARGGSMPNSLWYIEHNEHPLLGDNVEKVNYPNPGFLGKFWELHKVMWRTNAGLTDSHAWDSRPESWPILRRGINFWGKHHMQVYLIGNPLIWWSVTATVALWVLFKGVAIIRWQRSCDDYAIDTFKRFDYEIGTSVLGWALHYFPFYLMKRQLFLHHYFPALYFGIIALCQMFDFVTARIPIALGTRSLIFNRVAGITFLALSAAVFALFSPLAYGNPWTRSECSRLKIIGSWDFDCNTFLDNYEGYSSLTLTEAPIPASTPDPVIAENVQEQKPLAPVEKESDAGISQAPPVPAAPIVHAQEQRILSMEHLVEYRDQNGNLLDAEQVKALEGKVEFKTKYETKTRVVDENGRELLVDGAADSLAHVEPNVPVQAKIPEVEKETVQADDAAAPQEDVPMNEVQNETASSEVPKAEAETEVRPESAAQPEAQVVSETQAESEMEIEVEVEVQPESEVKQESEAKPESEAKHESEAQKEVRKEEL